MIITQLNGQRCSIVPLEALDVWKVEPLKALVLKLAAKDAREPKQKPVKVLDTGMILEAFKKRRRETVPNTLERSGLYDFAIDLSNQYGDSGTRCIYCALIQGSKKDLEILSVEPSPETIEFRGYHIPVRIVVFGLLMAVGFADSIDTITNRSPMSRMPVMALLNDLKAFFSSELKKCFTRNFRDLEITGIAGGKPYRARDGEVIIYTTPEIYEDFRIPNGKTVAERTADLVEKAAGFDLGLGEIAA